jgi:PAS domain S-box-containing protein
MKPCGPERKGTIRGNTHHSRPAEDFHQEGVLRYWRERILFVLLGIGLVVGLFVFIPMAVMAVREGLWALLAINTIVFILAILLLVFRQIRYEIRALFTVLLTFGVGCFVVWHFGLLSGGPFWLFTSSIMAGLLLGLRTTIAVLIINGLTLLTFVWLRATGRWGQDFPFFLDSMRGLVAAANFILLNAVATFSSTVLIRGLDESGEKEHIARKSLNEEHEKLLKEINERIKTGEALSESERRYRLLAENATDTIWTMSLETKAFTYFSPSVFKVRGFTPEEAMKLSMEEQLAPRSFQYAMKVLERELALDGEERLDPYRFGTMEVEQLCKDGSYAWAEMNVRIVRDEKGQAVEILGVSRDIRERKRREGERKVLEARLQQSRRMEAIATLAGGIAHQFNNALSVIIGRLDLLEMDLAKEDYRENIQPIKESARLLTALTSQLLAYARGGKYQVSAISVCNLVKETLPLVKQLTRPDILVETDLPEGLSCVKADVTQMQMVMSAVLSNASEAIESEGCIRVFLKNDNITQDAADRLPGLKAGPYVRLVIEDDGKGMDEETKNHLFEPFFSTKFQGRGLGMAAVYGIVKNHDGCIFVDSEPGKGTRVSIYLPAIDERDETAKTGIPAFVEDLSRSKD